MAVITAARSPAWSCWLAVAPAITLAAVIVPVHGALLRTLRRKTGRIRIAPRLAQEDHDAAVHARLADVNMRLCHRSLQRVKRFPIVDNVGVPIDRRYELPAAVVDTDGDSS